MSSGPVRVESVSNPRVGLLRSLGSARGIRKAGLYLLEGPRYVADALPRGEVRLVAVADGATPSARRAAERALSYGVPCISLPDSLYGEVSDTVTGQGVVAACALPDFSAHDLLEGSLILALDRVADPGNVGTAIRSAAALGATGVALLKGSACPFTPKSTRASAGAVGALPVAERVDAGELLAKAVEMGWRVLVADASGSQLEPEDRSRPVLLVVGSEAHGVSGAAEAAPHRRVAIPMTGRVESLNAAVSASILLYALAAG